MTLRQFILSLRSKLASADETTRPVIEAQIAELEQVEPEATPTTPPIQNPGNADLGQVIAQAITQTLPGAIAEVIKPIDQKLTAMERRIDERERAEGRATLDVSIKGLLDQAITDGKIPVDKREHWKGRAEKDFETIKGIIDELPKSMVTNRPTPTAPDGVPKKVDSKLARSIPPNVMKYVQDGISETN